MIIRGDDDIKDHGQSPLNRMDSAYNTLIAHGASTEELAAWESARIRMSKYLGMIRKGQEWQGDIPTFLVRSQYLVTPEAAKAQAEKKKPIAKVKMQLPGVCVTVEIGDKTLRVRVPVDQDTSTIAVDHMRQIVNDAVLMAQVPEGSRAHAVAVEQLVVSEKRLRELGCIED